MKYLYIQFILILLLFSQSIKANSFDKVRYFPEFEQNEVEEEIDNTLQEQFQENHNIEFDELFSKIVREKKLIGKLDKNAIFSLPVGLYDDADNPNYLVAIDSANIYPDYATFFSYMMITNPINGKKLRFKSNEVMFSFENGLESPVEMILIDTCSIPIAKGIELKIYPSTKAYWDCQGFNGIDLVGQFNFAGNTFIKVNSKGEPTGGNITIPIHAKINSLNEFLVNIDIPAFKIKGFDEAYFQFNQVVLDMSEKENAEGFTLPAGYPNLYDSRTLKLWQGLYIKNASVVLTKLHKKSNEPVVFSANNLLWDENGLSCIAACDNEIIPIEDGSLGGWPFSLDHFEMEFVAGDFKKVAFSGEVVPKGYNPDTPMEYSALIDFRGHYSFGVSMGKNMKLNLLMATVNLEPNSTINIELDNGKFLPSAMLYGDISFGCSKGDGDNKKILTTPYLHFEGMNISTVAPYFKIQSFAVSGLSSSKLGGFPLTIDSIRFNNRENEALLSFSVFVNLKESSSEGFGGSTDLSVVGELGNSSWKFKKVEVNHIHIDVRKPKAFTLVGDIWFIRGDEVYGDGFSGQITASFSKFAEIQASALFGKVNGFRYFNVDALLTLKTGLQAGPITLFGFGGGLSYRMKQAGFGENVPAFAKSLSGLSYKPDADAGIGIMAAVKFGIISQNLIQAEVKFSILFYKGGGIKQISFLGEASVLSVASEITESGMMTTACALANGGEVPEQTGPPIRLRMYMLIDFDNDSFHAQNEVFINVLGVIKGIGANDRAGWTVVHIEGGEWYIHVGTPSDPCGINILGMVKTKSYFMAGHGIPDSMPMNPKVLEYLGMSQADFDGERSETDLTTGKGIAFGCSFEFDTGNMNFLMFYGRFELGFGFDIMMVRNDALRCAGHEGPRGIDNWFAKGQAYVYFSGEIGIKVNLFLKKKDITILSLQCAAAMRAEGPNPFWAMGVIGGKYNLLNGMIKGDCRFEVEVGEKCEVVVMKSVEEQLAELEVISDISPADAKEDVSVFSQPQIVFNLPVNKEVKISEDESITRTFRIKINKCKVLGEKDGHEEALPGDFTWNSDKTVTVFTPINIFNPKEKYKVEASVMFEEKINGSWVPFKDESGEILTEDKTSEFTTGKLPDKIPSDAIKYSYPLNRMVNFYKDEYPMGYVTFKCGLAPYFNNNNDWEQKVRFIGSTGNVGETALNYSASSVSAEFNIPSSLMNEDIYSLEFVNIPIMENKAIDRNVKESNTDISTGNEENSMTLKTRHAEGEIQEAKEKVFYEIHFRTSKYNSLADKIGTNELIIRHLKYVSPGVDILMATIYPNEPFDGYELNALDSIEPLIQITADLNGADWYQSNVYPYIYETYPLHSAATITNRNTSIIGIPPYNDIRIKQRQKTRLLTNEEIESGTFFSDVEFTHFDYALPVHWAGDYCEIKDKLAQIYYQKVKPNKVDYLIRHPFWPRPSLGNYPIVFKYILPGRRIVTTTKEVNLKCVYDINQIDYEHNEDLF